MKTKFTPAPWRVHNTIGNDEPAEFDGLTVQSDFGLIVTLPQGDEKEPDEENLANARLIAAAPELLEAIKALFAAMDSQRDELCAANIAHVPELEAARAAIAKADGQP